MTLSKLWVHVCTEKAMLAYTGHTGCEMTSLAEDTSLLVLSVQLGSLMHLNSVSSHSNYTAGTASVTMQ